MGINLFDQFYLWISGVNLSVVKCCIVFVEWHEHNIRHSHSQVSTALHCTAHLVKCYSLVVEGEERSEPIDWWKEESLFPMCFFV